MDAGKPKPPGIGTTAAGIYHAAQAASATIMAQPSTIRASQPLQPPPPNQFPPQDPNRPIMVPPGYIYNPYMYNTTYQPSLVMYPYPYQQQQQQQQPVPSFPQQPRMIPPNQSINAPMVTNYPRPMTAQSTAANFKPNPTNTKSIPSSKPISDVISSTMTTEDQEKFKRKLLTNNNRKAGWHLFLFEDDRSKIDNILQEAVEFEKHFANFEREFEKMSQTTTTIGDGSLLTYSSMWGSWKENLLNRRQQMVQLQEKTLNNLYQKVCQMYPLVVTTLRGDPPAKSESTASATKPNAIQSPAVTPSVNVFPAQVTASQPNDTIAVNEPKDDEKKLSSSLSLESQTAHKPEQPDVASKSKIDEPNANQIPKDENRKNPIKSQPSQQVQVAFKLHEQTREELWQVCTDASFLKTLNDLTFIRNEVAFLEDQLNLASGSFRKTRGRKEVVNSGSYKWQKPDAVVDQKVVAKQTQNSAQKTEPREQKTEDIKSKTVDPKASVASEPKKPLLALLGNPKKPLLTDPKKCVQLDSKKALLTNPKKPVQSDPKKALLTDPKKPAKLDSKKPLLTDPKISLLPDPKTSLLPKPNPNTNLIQIPCQAKVDNPIQDRKNVMVPPKNSTLAANRPTLLPKQPTNTTDRVSVLIPVQSTLQLPQTTTVKTTAKVQERTNNIQIPLVFDSSSSSITKDKTINKPNPRSLTEIPREPLQPSFDHHPLPHHQNQSKRILDSNPWPSIAQLQQQQLQKPIPPTLSPPSQFVESTYYDRGGDSNSSSLSDRFSKLPPSTVSSNDAKVSCVDINLFIERERQLLHEERPPPVLSPEARNNLDHHPMSVKQNTRYTMPEFFTTPRKYTEEPLYIKDLLDFPARTYRPHKIAFLIRGLPGSGKSRLAEWIHKKEKQNNALVKSRVLSLDHYYMVDVEDDEDHHHNYRKSKPPTKTMMVYDASKESEYKKHLFKEFCRQCNSGYYNFLIVDTINSKINEVRDYYAYAIENNYIPYVIEMEAITRRLLNDCVDGEEIVAYCYKHNHQGRSLQEIRSLYEQWELLPPDYLRVDAYQLVLANQNSQPIDGPEEIGDVCDKELSKKRRIYDEKSNVSRYWDTEMVNNLTHRPPSMPKVSASKWWQTGDDQDNLHPKNRHDPSPNPSHFNNYNQEYAQRQEEDYRSRYDNRSNRSSEYSENSNSNNMKRTRLDQKDPMINQRGVPRPPSSSSSTSWSTESLAHYDNVNYSSSYYGPPLHEREENRKHIRSKRRR